MNALHEDHVFINCPFDDAYRPLFSVSCADLQLDPDDLSHPDLVKVIVAWLAENPVGKARRAGDDGRLVPLSSSGTHAIIPVPDASARAGD